PTPAGAQFAYLGGNVGVTVLRQDLATPLRAGADYTLSFLQSGFLFARGYPAEVIVTISPTDSTAEAFTSDFALADGADWTRQQATFSVPADGFYSLRLQSTQGKVANVDDVSLKPACLTPPAGMVAWWPANGDASDALGGSAGTLSNGAAFAAGKVGEGFSFSNAGVVSVPAASSLNLTTVTVEAWILLNSIPDTTADFCIVSKGITTSSENYGLYITRSGASAELSFEWFNGTFNKVQP